MGVVEGAVVTRRGGGGSLRNEDRVLARDGKDLVCRRQSGCLCAEWPLLCCLVDCWEGMWGGGKIKEMEDVGRPCRRRRNECASKARLRNGLGTVGRKCRKSC